MAICPPWLDKSFYVSILQTDEDARGGHSPVYVISCRVQPPVDSSCHYMSTIERVQVEYCVSSNSSNIKTRSFLIKAPLANNTINESILIDNELLMYDEIIPKILEIAQLEVAPKRYISPLTQVLVMDDLKEAGYMMCDSIKRLDYKHAKAVLVTLAKFHAASVAIKRDHPEAMERNGVETVYTHEPKYAERFKPRILMRLYGLAKVLQTINGCEKFGDILIGAEEAFWDLIVEMFKPNSKLNVLNHGDFWTNNMLFKYDSAGFISDVKLIDYQLRRYCSPAIDLLYLFFTSADDGVRMRMYELLEMYRHTLNSSLAELGCPQRLSRNDLKEDISKCSPLILLICLYLPVIFPDPDNHFDVSKVESSEDSLTSLDFDVNPLLLPFKNKYFRSALPEMCKELETMKIFKILMRNKKHKKKH
uniref:CHK kinase-like domain-containing protein n=1 Tax=Cuerna arida TaxID=1464854 RepID=A0A1B6GCW7_9HEMI